MYVENAYDPPGFPKSREAFRLLNHEERLKKIDEWFDFNFEDPQTRVHDSAYLVHFGLVDVFHELSERFQYWMDDHDDPFIMEKISKKYIERGEGVGWSPHPRRCDVSEFELPYNEDDPYEAWRALRGKKRPNRGHRGETPEHPIEWVEVDRRSLGEQIAELTRLLREVIEGVKTFDQPNVMGTLEKKQLEVLLDCAVKELSEAPKVDVNRLQVVKSWLVKLSTTIGEQSLKSGIGELLKQAARKLAELIQYLPHGPFNL